MRTAGALLQGAAALVLALGAPAPASGFTGIALDARVEAGSLGQSHLIASAQASRSFCDRPRVDGGTKASYSWRGADLIAGRNTGVVAGVMSFDAARQPIHSSYTNAERLAFGEQVAWSPRGLRNSVTRVDQNRSALAFAYDPAARLASAERVAGGTRRSFRDQPGHFGFGYDHADNLLLQSAEEECATGLVTLPLDGSGRNRPGSVQGVPLAWNRAGQLADRGAWHYSHDAVGRLERVQIGTDPRGTDGSPAASWVDHVRYEVDVLGRRVLEHAGGETIERVWSGWQELESYDTDGFLIERRTYGLGLDEVVSLELGPEAARTEYVPIYGTSGHVAMLVLADTGVPVEAYEYSPYGERSVYVNDLIGPAIEQVRARPEVIWIELSEEVRLDDAAAAITLENLTLGGQQLPVELSQPVLEGRNAGRRIAVWADLPDEAPAGQATWPPRPGEQVRLTVDGAGLVDEWGNVAAEGASRTWVWSGGDLVDLDTAAPKVLRVCVTADGRIEIELSEQPHAATLAAITVGGQSVAWSGSASGYLLISEPLAPGAHTLAIGTTLTDLVGTALAQAWSDSVDVVEGEASLAWAAPWPGAVGAGSSVFNRLGFHGLPHDPVTGLVYARNRDYDPETGRFVQTDPLGYVDSVSLYQYGLNNPVNFSDPTGEYVESPWDLASFGIGLASFGYNLWQGNYREAGVDALGLGADGVAILLPGVPGGAGVGIRAARAVQLGVHAGDVLQAGMQGYETYEAGHYGASALYATMGAVGGGTLARDVRAATGLGRMGAGLLPRQGGRGAKTLAEYRNYREHGATAAEARYLTRPYSGQYHHWFPQRVGYTRLGLPERVMESRFNLMGRRLFGKGSHLSRGEFYRRHALADPSFTYAHLKRGMRGWNAADYGISTASRPLRWWYATPRASKVALGGAAAFGSWAYFGRDRAEESEE